MSFWKGLRAMFDVPRLHARISELENQISLRDHEIEDWKQRAISGPSFSSVAVDFDAEPVMRDARERVTRELAAIIKPELIPFLERAVNTVEPQDHAPIGQMAYDTTRDIVRLHFHLPELHRHIEVAGVGRLRRYGGGASV